MAEPDSDRKPLVSADAFFAIDIRVGRIVNVEEFPEARRPAYKIWADFGPLGTLQTSAQVTNYDADSLAGRMVVGVVNLGTKRIAGFSSEFLLLGSYDKAAVVRLLSPAPEASVGDVVG